MTMTTTPLNPPFVPPHESLGDGIVRYPVDGALIIANRHVFKQRILDLFEQGAREVRIDLTDCGYIDASGLGVLISLSHAGDRKFNGARIILERPNEDLRALFALTRLDTLFRFEPDESEGVE